MFNEVIFFVLVTKSLTKHITIHNHTTILRTLIPTVMRYIVHHLIVTKHHRLPNIMPIIIIHVNPIQQVITQTYQTHFIRITQKRTRIRIITIIIVVIKITDQTMASMLIVFYCGNKSQGRNKMQIIIRRFLMNRKGPGNAETAFLAIPR